MLNKQLLLRRTEEAKKRIELEQQLEEERRRQEEEARRLEKKLARQLEFRRNQSRREAKRIATELFNEAVRVACQGGHSTCFNVEPSVSEFLTDELTAAGFTFVKERASAVEIDFEARLELLLSELDKEPGAFPYQESLIKALEIARDRGYRENPTGAVLKVMDDFQVDEERGGGRLSELFEAFFERPAQEKHLDGFRVHWQPIKLTEQVFSAQGHMASWLLSASGCGLMQRVGECAAAQADAGERYARFELVSLSANKLRWGSNNMTKLVHRGQPIGVTPFTQELMLALFSALGFETEQVVADGSSFIKVSW